MKEYFNKIAKAFSQYRDWLLVLLVVAGIGIFLRQIQAEQNKDPEQIWMEIYPDQVAPPPGLPGMPGVAPNPQAPTGQDSPATGPAGSFDFAPLDREAVESMSTQPIFTNSEEYTTLLNRLKQLRAEFQEAQDRADIKTAIERLRRYVAEDPSGKRLSDWTTEPKELLQNLVCNELSQSVESALTKGEEDRQAALVLVDGEPDRAIESIREVKASIDRTLREVESNTECQDDTRISSDRIESLKTLQKRVEEDSKKMEDRLVSQKYDRVLQQASGIGPTSLPDQVAQILQSIQEFRNLLEGIGGGALTQTQIDRLAEIETNVQTNKATLITQVQQKVDQLTAEPDAEQKAEKVEEILRQLSILKLLGEAEAKVFPERRKWEQILRKLEATDDVKKLGELIKEIKADLDQAETLKSGNEDTSQVLKRVNNSFSQFDQIKKNNKGVSSVPAYKKEVYPEYQKQKRRLTQIQAGAK